MEEEAWLRHLLEACHGTLRDLRERELYGGAASFPTLSRCAAGSSASWTTSRAAGDPNRDAAASMQRRLRQAKRGFRPEPATHMLQPGTSTRATTARGACGERECPCRSSRTGRARLPQ